MSFIDTLIEKAKSNIKTIVLPESYEERNLKATDIILKEKIANIVLIGKKDEIKKEAAKFGANVDGAIFIDPEQFDKFDDFIQTFYELRKNKGVTQEQAREIMKDPMYFAVMLVYKGLADGMVSGAIHSTADTLRPALQILKTKPGIKLVSSFFIMVVPNCEYGENGVFIYSDAGLNPNPNAEELADIAITSAKSFEALVGKTPKVAMLSYSTKGSAKSDMVDKVVEATKLAKEKAPEILIDGELQADAAIVPKVAKLKAPGSSVAGEANVLIFPDLDAGNIAYKLTERLAKAEAYGPITQGIAKPINDLSRGCSAEDIVGVVAITAVQAMME
ncbi:phosphate acetyltransferase [Caldicellulosiruptoraceae bacterium PP1]